MKKLFRVSTETQSLRVVLWFTDPDHTGHDNHAASCPGCQEQIDDPWLEIERLDGDPSSPMRQRNFRLKGIGELDELLTALVRLKEEAK